MIGYKVFENDWTCRGFQYEVGKTYETEEEPICCRRGFHFCNKLVNCFNYYNFDSNNKVAIVEILGDVDTSGDKSCTNKLHILKELTWYEVLEMVNTGNRNTGNRNTGNFNTGNRNAGDFNTGYYNTGNHNTGDYNTGDFNTGNHNTGDYNTGDFNTGDFNTGYGNSGCFNTLNSNMTFFNQLSNWTYSDWNRSKARAILDTMPMNTLKWICLDSMTYVEKEFNPEYETTSGYLKMFKATKVDKQTWWDNLSDKYKEEVLSLPNFNADIFEEITGINVRPK